MMMIDQVGLSRTTLGFVNHKSSFGWFQIGICLANSKGKKAMKRCLFKFVYFQHHSHEDIFTIFYTNLHPIFFQ